MHVYNVHVELCSILVYVTVYVNANLFYSALDFVCDHPDIRAISFVGSDRVGKYIYERGSANGKRVQSNMVHYIIL